MSDDEDVNWDEEEDAMETSDQEEEEEEEEDEEVEKENTYYTAKESAEEGDVEDALKGFEKVIKLEVTTGNKKPGEWGFKSIKKICKLQFKKQRYEDVIKSFDRMLGFNKAVTENALNKGIDSILDTVSNAKESTFLLRMYKTALERLKERNNEKIWLKTMLKLGKLLLDSKDWRELHKVLQDLYKYCSLEDGTPDPKKGANLLDVYALDIQMAMAQKNKKRTKELQQKGIETAAANPGTLNAKLSIFHFCGGKIHMEEKEWEKASTAFYEAFRFYEEAGSPLRIPCLQYIILANMLMSSQIDPFNSPETKNLKSHAQISPMADLLGAYQTNDLARFEKILKDNKKTILEDEFIRLFIEDLLREMRTQVLFKMIKPYTKINIPYVSKELNIPPKDVEALLVSLILDRKIEGRVDQVKQLLELERPGAQASNINKYRSIAKWTNQLSSLHQSIVSKVG